MPTRTPATVKRATTTKALAPAAPGARRPGAVRRATTAAAPALAAVPVLAAAPALAAAPEIHEAHGAPETAAEEQVRVRAYSLHLERRGRPADPTADWLRAEQEQAARGGDASPQG